MSMNECYLIVRSINKFVCGKNEKEMLTYRSKGRNWKSWHKLFYQTKQKKETKDE